MRSDTRLALIYPSRFPPTKLQLDQTQAKGRPNRVHRLGLILCGILRDSESLVRHNRQRVHGNSPALIALGHPAEERPPHGREDRYDATKVHYGLWEERELGGDP